MTKGNNYMIFICILIIIGILAILAIKENAVSCCSPEHYGQDASIRAQSGWIAGPRGMYGYDPIDRFAEQIRAMESDKKYLRKSRRKTPKLIVMKDKNIESSSPTKNIGPSESYIENHGPYTRKCSYQSDCWDGESCYAGTCIPSDLKPSGLEPYKPKQECKSCISTEDFEHFN